MTTTGRSASRSSRAAVYTLVLFLFAALIPPAAMAATADDARAGDVLRTLPVGIPTANCATVGPALAMVQTSKLNVAPSVIAQFPVVMRVEVLALDRQGVGEQEFRRQAGVRNPMQFETLSGGSDRFLNRHATSSFLRRSVWK